MLSLVLFASLASCLPSMNYADFSPKWETHQLFRRSLIVCDSTGVFVTGDNTSLINDVILSKPDDTFLEAFSAPATGFLCTLSVQLKAKTNTDVIASLSIFNDSISSTAIVGGTAASIGASSATTNTDILMFHFCSDSPSLSAAAVYYFQIKLAASSAPIELIFGDSTAQSLVYGPSFSSPQTLNGGVSFNLTVGNSVPTCPSDSTTTTAILPTPTTTTSFTSTVETTDTTSSSSSTIETTDSFTTTESTESSKVTTDSTTTTDSIQTSTIWTTEITTEPIITSTTESTQTSTDSTTTSTATELYPFPTPSGPVYCYCRGHVKSSGFLKKRSSLPNLAIKAEDDEDDEWDDDEDDLLVKRQEIQVENLQKRNTIFYWDNDNDSSLNLVKRSSKSYTIRFKTKCGKFRCKCKTKKNSSTSPSDRIASIWNC